MNKFRQPAHYLSPFMAITELGFKPKMTLDEWETLLDDAVELGLAKITKDPYRFAGSGSLFGAALLKRWQWLQKARADNLTDAQAEARWDAWCDEIASRSNQRYAAYEKSRANTARESRDKAQKFGRRTVQRDSSYAPDGEDFDSLMDYADTKIGLP